ncbi:hypothetical protein PABG_00253 [Paracoccidioides brasiliensis Pb03]|uniref:CENP-V/GFA domain-containing protein n=1 Tax=Paracoccidioides brasiliensis (strain Pb18) TaxID=502780 RepID=C1G652_PARBD|nr:uncharacterized protein PADG_02657 [Paracoccidioides brasiliensis Pb18]EEH17690.1 hypothetical protein PABG_00253 [Paracoccidioides brasiliensis Pb03]EEH46559.1 hypothetical protein PADG_02657 [Paracoccidioides brasiliensis Pb18]
MSTSTSVLTGGCACSHIRYSSTALPSHLTHCFCIECRKTAGGPFQSYVCFPTAAVTWINEGHEPIYFHASTFARRGFCDKCGSSLVFQMNESPESISLTAGSIDDWDVKWGGSDGDQKEGGQGAAEKEGWDKLIRSSVYYWAREKPSWHKLPNDGVVKYFTDPDIEEQPPGWGGEEEDPWETDKKG